MDELKDPAQGKIVLDLGPLGGSLASMDLDSIESLVMAAKGGPEDPLQRAISSRPVIQGWKPGDTAYHRKYKEEVVIQKVSSGGEKAKVTFPKGEEGWVKTENLVRL